MKHYFKSNKKQTLLIALLLSIITIGSYHLKIFHVKKEIVKEILKFNKNNEINVNYKDLKCSGFFKTNCKFNEVEIISYDNENKDTNDTRAIKKQTIEEFYIEDIENILNNNEEKKKLKGYINGISDNLKELFVLSDYDFKNYLNHLNNNKIDIRTKSEIKEEFDIYKKLFKNEKYRKLNENNISEIEFDLEYFFFKEKFEDVLIHNLKFKSNFYSFSLKDTVIPFVDRKDFKYSKINNINLYIYYDHLNYTKNEEKKFKIISSIVSISETNLILFKEKTDEIFDKNKISNNIDELIELLPVTDKWKEELKKIYLNKDINNILISGNNNKLENIYDIQFNFLNNNKIVDDKIIKEYNLELKLY